MGMRTGRIPAGSTDPLGEEVRRCRAWRLRDYHDEDLDQAISVWDQSCGLGLGRTGVQRRRGDGRRRAGEPAVVAEVGDEVVGMAVAQTQGERAWDPAGRPGGQVARAGSGFGAAGRSGASAPLGGVRRICAVMPEGATGAAALENSGYARRDRLVHYELIEHPAPTRPTCSRNSAARSCRPACGAIWPGMEYEKQIIERRIVDPPTPEVAERYGVSRPGRHPCSGRPAPENQLRQSDFVTAGLAVRRTVPVPAGRHRHRRAGRLAAGGLRRPLRA